MTSAHDLRHAQGGGYPPPPAPPGGGGGYGPPSGGYGPPGAPGPGGYGPPGYGPPGAPGGYGPPGGHGPPAPPYGAPLPGYPGAPPPGAPLPVHPIKKQAQTWLIIGGVSFMTCGCMFGVIGIVFCYMAMQAADAGNFADAENKLKWGKITTLVGFGIGVILSIVGLLNLSAVMGSLLASVTAGSP